MLKYLEEKLGKWKLCIEVTYKDKSKTNFIKYENKNLLNH